MASTSPVASSRSLVIDIERSAIPPHTTRLQPTGPDLIHHANSRDLERGPARDADDAEKKPELESFETENPYLVTWDGPDDPTNPFNWSLWRKWVVTILTSLGGMVTLMSSTMMAPALPAIAQDLHTDDATTQLTLSIFVLSFGFGPMVLAPMTEVFGRKPVWLLSGCFYILWNTVCGFSKTNSVMIASRFFAGLGGSSQYAVEYPVLADCWRLEQRGRSFAISTFLPLLGPAIGPILGGVLAGSIGWRWLFWVLSIFDASLMLVALFMFPETHAETILHRKAKILRKQTNQEFYTDGERESRTLSSVLTVSMARPCRLLLTQPLIQLMSVYLAYNYGILYIVQSTFATLWIERYNQSVSVSGLHYIAITVGCIFAAQAGAYFMDRVWRHLKARAKGESQPEYRIPLMLPGAVIIPIGLFWYGWSAQARAFWLLPDIGIAIFSFGIIVGTQAMQAYVMDSFPKYVASASAASQLLRNLAGFSFPVFAPKMYQTLDYGWGNSLLAFIFLAIGVPAPLILWKYGAKLRAKGKHQW